MQAEPTNRELMHFLEDLRDGVSGIKERLTVLNGSVAAIKTWKERATGGSTVILITLLPILGWGLLQITNIEKKVQAGVKDELSKYEITIVRQ